MPVLVVGDDARRFDDDDGVEFETLHDTDGDQGDALVETGAGGGAVVDAGGGQVLGQLVDHRVGSDRRRGSRSAATSVIERTSSATAAPSGAVAPERPRAAASPTRTDCGARSVGVAAAITLLASSMIWPGMR